MLATLIQCILSRQKCTPTIWAGAKKTTTTFFEHIKISLKSVSCNHACLLFSALQMVGVTAAWSRFPRAVMLLSTRTDDAYPSAITVQYRGVWVLLSSSSSYLELIAVSGLLAVWQKAVQCYLTPCVIFKGVWFWLTWKKSIESVK